MIESYGFGYIVIDGRRYTSDVFIYPDRVESHWVRRSGHTLIQEDPVGVLKAGARTLVVGTGHAGLMRVPSETLECLQSAGWEVIVQRTGQACETYNRLAELGPVIAALHLTC
jgi:hypothetical protein